MLTSGISTPGLSLSASQRLTAAVFAAIFGSFMLYLVGFAHSETLHNSAHDTRHAVTVPCH